ncbi:hypothetical protein RR46_00113 [Papilio xuthus]|uniref:Uncharacterized protein n=1 Tax=Papilio xuthus TaxID=66420 RepID=A0A0N0PEX4_PAPXU|nr:hypothetical protein RR46_00113 [Papilio xuthus]
MSGDAQLAVISVPSARNDLVLGLVAPADPTPDLVGELLGVLAHRYHAYVHTHAYTQTHTHTRTRTHTHNHNKAIKIEVFVFACQYRICVLTGSELIVEVESGVTTRCILGGKSRALQLPPAPPHHSPHSPHSPTPPAPAPAPVPPFTHAHNVITYHPTSARA